ncbi:hypothetical protein [Microcoleus sp. Z1_C3]|uniref:hypothetical protein n=1 Tax=unclassified Microcoleus TaxID=2642155 RepID=UPI002FD65649
MLTPKMAMLTIKMATQKSNNSPEQLNISVQSLPEAKLAIKALKLKKKEYALVKRELTQQQKMIRAEYTDKVRQQGSKVRGGGSLGSLARTFQTANRDADRRALAKQLAPLEEQKNAVDAVITAIDQAILQLEKYIVENS